MKLLVPIKQGGGRVVRWCWENFQCRGVLLIWFPLCKGQVILLSGVCEGEGGGGEESSGVRILFRCSTKGEIGVGWSLLFLGILGWEGGEDH